MTSAQSRQFVSEKGRRRTRRGIESNEFEKGRRRTRRRIESNEFEKGRRRTRKNRIESNVPFLHLGISAFPRRGHGDREEEAGELEGYHLELLKDVCCFTGGMKDPRRPTTYACGFGLRQEESSQNLPEDWNGHKLKPSSVEPAEPAAVKLSQLSCSTCASLSLTRDRALLVPKSGNTSNTDIDVDL